MTNFYTPPTLTGYNQSPPVNDGTQVSQNLVNWDTHTGKIGDPLKDFSESINTQLTTTFEDITSIATNIAELTAIASGSSPSSSIFVQGYNTIGDGGGGNFFWDSGSTETENLITIFESDEGGTGRWIRQGLYLDVKMGGAVGDGVTDDAEAIQRALDLGRDVCIPDGIFMYEPAADRGYVTGNIIYGTGTLRLHFPSGNPTTNTFAQILRPKNYDDADDVAFYDITLDGNRDNIDFSGVTAGDGNAFGLALWGVKNAIIDNVTVKNCWTDGFYFAYTHSSKSPRRNNTNIQMGTLISLNSGRNAMSIVSMSGFTLDAFYVDGVDRAAPKAALDLEPNNVSPDKIENGSIGIVESNNTGAGVLFSGVSNIENITLNSMSCRNVLGALGLHITTSKNIQIGQAYIHLILASFPALNIDDYTNVHIGSFVCDLEPGVVVGTNMVNVENVTGLNDHTGLRIEHLHVNGSVGNAVNIKVNTEVSIGYARVSGDLNRIGAGGVAFLLSGDVHADRLEVDGTGHDHSLRLGSDDISVDSAGFNGAAISEILLSGFTPTFGDRVFADDESVTRIDRTFTIASGAEQELPEITSNKGFFKFIVDDRPKYMGTFGAFGTELPLDLGSGANVLYATADGGTTADDQMRVYPSSASNISIRNNTVFTQSIRVIIEMFDQS